MQADLVKDNGHTYFIKYLDSAPVADGAADLNSRAQAAFVLAAVCDSHPRVRHMNRVRVDTCHRSPGLLVAGRSSYREG